MNKSGAGAVLILALVMITGLSVMYWKDVGERIVTATSSVDGQEIPICSVQTDVPLISLSFDTVWGNEDTQRILEILANHQVKATFFVTGSWVEQYPEIAGKILECGHDLGNYSEHYRQMDEISGEECRKEIMELHERVKKLTGYEMNLFRPPYGNYNNTVIKTVYACGYYPVLWSLDSLDWKNYGTEDIIEWVTENENLGNGTIILCRNGGKYTVEALDGLLTGLEEQGYELVPVSQLIYKEHYYMDLSGRQMPDEKNDTFDDISRRVSPDLPVCGTKISGGAAVCGL